MKRRMFTAITAAAATAAVAPAFAETVSIVASKDNTLYEFPTGDISNGSGSYMFAGRTGQEELSIRRALVAFDIASAIPAGSVITEVTLRLHMSKTPAGASQQTLHRVLANWGEGASNDSAEEGNGTGAQTNDATWIHSFYQNSFWNNEGGDFASTPSASALVGGVGFYTWSSATMVSEVQLWLNNPGSNFGWLIHGDESASRTVKRYDTSENGTASRRPTLIITYEVPAPATALPFAAAALAFTRRRRA